MGSFSQVIKKSISFYTFTFWLRNMLFVGRKRRIVAYDTSLVPVFFAALTVLSVGKRRVVPRRSTSAKPSHRYKIKLTRPRRQVASLQKQTDENKQSIGDLDRQVATADEKAADAGRRPRKPPMPPLKQIAPPQKPPSAPIPPTLWPSRRSKV